MSLRSLVFAIAVGSAALAGCRTDPVRATQTQSATALADGGKPQKPGPVDELPLPKDVVEKTVNPEHRPEYKGPTGVVEGVVYVTGAPAPPVMGKSFAKCPEAESVYAKAFREGPDVGGKRALADALVAVTGYGEGEGEGKYYLPEKQGDRVVTINHCSFGTRTIDMTYGQALLVKNEGSAPMFAPDFENQLSPAIMVATLNGDPVKLYPKLPGRYRLVDRLGHSWMDADVWVFRQPLHAVTDVAGHFRIEGVPVGKLKVGARHFAIDNQAQVDVEVKGDVVSHVTLVIANTKAAPQPASRNLKPVLP